MGREASPARAVAFPLVNATDSPYLVGLNLEGRRVVVVGGGTVAQRRLPLLISSGAVVHVVTREATPAVEAMASNCLLDMGNFARASLHWVCL